MAFPVAACSRSSASPHGVGVWPKAREYPYASAPRRLPGPVRIGYASLRRDRVPMNPKRVQELLADRHPPVAERPERPRARQPDGRRAHQTWRRLGAGNGVIGVRSRVLSIPSAEIGSQRSIRRVSAIGQSMT